MSTLACAWQRIFIQIVKGKGNGNSRNIEHAQIDQVRLPTLVRATVPCRLLFGLSLQIFVPDALRAMTVYFFLQMAKVVLEKEECFQGDLGSLGLLVQSLKLWTISKIGKGYIY